jgi:hypothetical protein
LLSLTLGTRRRGIGRQRAGDERAAADRAVAAEDRETTRRDRAAAARDRVRAAADREQAAVERAQHGYVPTRGGSSFRRVQAVRGQAQETAKAAAHAAADLVERFIQIKQYELTIHLASIEVYEQLATCRRGWATRTRRPRRGPRRSGRRSPTGWRVWSWRSIWRGSRLLRIVGHADAGRGPVGLVGEAGTPVAGVWLPSAAMAPLCRPSGSDTSGRHCGQACGRGHSLMP